MSRREQDNLYAGLRALGELAFPKTCARCNRTYHSLEEYLAATESIDHCSGLMQAMTEQDENVIALFRNCVCHSTLMVQCGDRRDVSPRGVRRREIFGDLLLQLTNSGLDTSSSRGELLKVMRGEPSAVLQNMGVSFA
ncbi:MAG: oxidoreductase [Verrucomicrobia bacterium]|nr:oxidoreductase [Verrucomicrobiota bacterium]